MPGPTRPDLIFGVNNRHPASVGTGTNSLGTVLYEEQSSGTAGSGVGFGQRLAVRHYENYAYSTWLGGSDPLTKFNGGRMVVTSISGGYILGSHNSDWNDLFDRMYALDFGGTDTSGAGTKKPGIAPLCLYHEVEAGHGVDAAAYVTAFKSIRSLRDARALVAGVPAARVPLMTIFTAYGVSSGTAPPYWPGNDQVDIFGIDGYSGLHNSPWREAKNVFGSALTFAANHGNKDVWICETSVKTETGHDVGLWWSNFADFVAANPQIKSVLAFQGAPGDTTVNFDKTAYPGKHEGMRQFIITTGATAGYNSGSVTQLKPSSPTGVTFASDPSGLFGTLTWAANPSGDNVTLWDVYQASGKVTSGFTKVNATSLPAAPRSYTITGLTPGSPYTFTVAAVNAVGRSGFGNMFQAVTSLPGPTNLAPTIDSFSADVDATDSTLIHFTSSATDPNGDPLTYTIAVTGANGFTQTLAGPNADANFDPGAYQAALSVSDGTLTTTQVVPFRVVVLPLITPDSGYELPQPGDDLREITRIYRQTIPDIDSKLTLARKNRNTHNTLHGFVASTFDPVLASTTKTAYAAGDFRWYWMKLEADTITGLATYLSDAQTGAGVAFCVHAADGSQLCNVQTGSALDTALSGTGDVEFDLDQPITGRQAGEVVAFGLYFPPATTPFKTYLSAATNVMGQVRLTQGYWRGNGVGSQASYPDVLPFSSAAVYIPAFFALY